MFYSSYTTPLAANPSAKAAQLLQLLSTVSDKDILNKAMCTRLRNAGLCHRCQKSKMNVISPAGLAWLFENGLIKS